MVQNVFDLVLAQTVIDGQHHRAKMADRHGQLYKRRTVFHEQCHDIATRHTLAGQNTRYMAYPMEQVCIADAGIAIMNGQLVGRAAGPMRSEERRVGKEWVITVRSGWCPVH